MSKDGTNRGGRRPRSGPSKEPLADKALKGRPADVMQFPIASLDAGELPEGEALEGVDMPKPSEYLSAKQRDIKTADGTVIKGKPLGADKIYIETMKWLKARGCDKLINHRQVESYAEAFARYIQCSEALSKYGLIGKHPTTQLPTKSPYVDMQIAFQKQANVIWYEIFQVVKENSLTPFEGMPTGDGMEQLIMGRKPW